MKFNVICDTLLIALFGSAICLPLVKADFRGGGCSPAENRYLSEFPEIFDDSQEFRGDVLKDEFEEWINDNAFGREFFYTVNTKLNLKLFNLHNTDEILYGKDRWIYLMVDHNIERIQNADSLQGEKRILLENNINKISKIIQERVGCYFQVNVFPCKSDIYPEYLPSVLKKVSQESSLDMYTDLSRKTAADINVLYDTMIEHKQDGPLIYYKATDTNHWNHLGAYYGYLEIMNQIKEKIPSIKILSFDDFIVSEKQVDTTIAGEYFTSETDFNFELKDKRTAQEDKNHFNEIGFFSADTWNSYNYYKNENQSLPKAIIIGDSYTWMFMLPNLAESFSELYFIHAGGDKNHLNNILNFISPDIILVNGLTETVTDFFMNFNTDKIDLKLPSRTLDFKEQSYAFLDYINDEAIQNNNPDLFVNPDAACITLHGWGIDVLQNQLASSVIVEVGDHIYYGNYGNERQIVADYFSNQQLLKSGFDVAIDTKQALKAGGFKLHIISNDGTYEYPPISFNVYAK